VSRRKVSSIIPESSEPLLPDRFATWFAARGWTPREHQLALLQKARQNRSALLIAPTGAGKTLAGFLPSLVELSGECLLPLQGGGRIAERSGRRAGAPESDPPPQPSPARGEEAGTASQRRDAKSRGLHTLYISPLKALAVDIARNLEAPIAQMKLPIRVETRTGDTPMSRRARQRKYPPDILLTTPEQLALLLASDDAPYLFATLKRVVLDELHALVTSKRGDLLSLGLARLWKIGPEVRAIGLSATVAEPESLARFLVPQRDGAETAADIVVAGGAAAPIVEMLDSKERLPWAGHSARHALGEIYDLIKANKTTLVFVNTRSQAEFLFQDLWRVNDDGLAIALHHGSLDVAQRRRVEDAMSAGKLRGVVCTSSLDLGVDWGDVDLVVNIGAPKGASRLMQRIGRANHRLTEASRAVLVPANRFEVLECRVAIDAVAENAQDTPPLRTGALDVLAQHVLGCACGEPFFADDLFAEVLTAAPYADITRADFHHVLDFVATGGYALKSYERFAKIRQDKEGRWRVANGRVRQSYRLNVGTIVEDTMIKVKLVGGGGPAARRRGGRTLGEVEESFIEQLVIGDTFAFAGEILRYEGLAEDHAFVTRANDKDAKVPSYFGGKFPLSTYLADRVRKLLHNERAWRGLPDQVRDWLSLQADVSQLPDVGDLLVETFPRANKHYLVCYPFEGRLAHQTLGMLLTGLKLVWDGFLAH